MQLNSRRRIFLVYCTCEIGRELFDTVCCVAIAREILWIVPCCVVRPEVTRSQQKRGSRRRET
jgi:hypothetical protein